MSGETDREHAAEGGLAPAWDGRTDPYEEAKLAKRAQGEKVKLAKEAKEEVERARQHEEFWSRYHRGRANLWMINAVVMTFSLTALVLMIFVDPVSGFERISVRAFATAALVYVSATVGWRLGRAMVREEFRGEPSATRGPLWFQVLRGPALLSIILLLIHA